MQGNAPSFPKELEVFNTDRPISLQDLEGRIVLIYFWSYSILECELLIKQIQQLEREFSDSLSVVGIHSPKFEGEKDREQLRKSILRLGIEHPIINDKDFRIWGKYGAKVWPTSMLITPLGDVSGFITGSTVYDALYEGIEALQTQFEMYLNPTKLIPLKRENLRTPQSVLSFPMGVIADPLTKKLYIADTANHRIVVTTTEGQVLFVIGNGFAGFADGAFETAQFDSPQGLALLNGDLYVADSGNNKIRRINTTSRFVETLPIQEYSFEFDAEGTNDTGVFIPTGLLSYGKTLLIASSGNNLIFSFDTESEQLLPFAGSGRLQLKDGKNETVDFAQPTSIAKAAGSLFVADSLSSSLRLMKEEENSVVVTTISGKSLFEYGDALGDTEHSLFQYPRALTYSSGKLFVTDSLNHKIKAIDPIAFQASLITGAEPGFVDGDFKEARFDFPTAITALDNSLYVCDTNNSAIRVVSLQNQTVNSLALHSLAPLEKQYFYSRESLIAESIEIRNYNHEELEALSVELFFPPDFEFTTGEYQHCKLIDKLGKIIQVKPFDEIEFLTGTEFAIHDEFFFEITVYYNHTERKAEQRIDRRVYWFKHKPEESGESFTLRIRVK